MCPTTSQTNSVKEWAPKHSRILGIQYCVVIHCCAMCYYCYVGTAAAAVTNVILCSGLTSLFFYCNTDYLSPLPATQLAEFDSSRTWAESSPGSVMHPLTYNIASSLPPSVVSHNASSSTTQLPSIHCRLCIHPPAWLWSLASVPTSR